MSNRSAYEAALADFTRHWPLLKEKILLYPPFRRLVSEQFALQGWKVDFKEVQLPCHYLDGKGRLKKNHFVNAWPTPSTYLLCHHEKNGTAGLSAFQSSKPPQQVQLTKMVVSPDVPDALNN